MTLKTLCQSLFINKVNGNTWKRDPGTDFFYLVQDFSCSGTGVFLWILRNFYKNLFKEHLHATTTASG